jgi:hypothetical protein
MSVLSGIGFTQATVRGGLPGRFATGIAPDESLALFAQDSDRQEWERIIDNQLVEWGLDPTKLADDGIESPSDAALSTASQLALAFRNAKFPRPTRVAPTGDGGVAFHWDKGQGTMLIFEVSDDGTSERIEIDRGNIVARMRT